MPALRNNMTSVPDESSIELESERQQAQALAWIIEGTEWLTAAEVASAAGVATSTVRRWKKNRRIFSIRLRGREMYPRYVFDPQYRPLAVVQEVLAVLRDSSEMSLAAWFESTSSFLRGKRPRELVATAAAQVSAAARNSRELERNPG